MNRREFLKCTAAGAAASWLGRVLPAEAKPAPKRRPNVVLILSLIHISEPTRPY